MPTSQEDILHSEIIEKLTDWADRNGVQSDRIIVSLLEDLEHEDNLAIWAEMDPFDYLPHPQPGNGVKFFTWAKNMASLRNVLVFLPVALTWEAVSKATEAFAVFVEKNNATTVNFLEFWQNGYDVLPSFWTISHIASLDFAIILCVIGLSLLSNNFHTKGSRLNKSSIQALDQNRIEMALILKMYLYSMREIDKNNVEEGVASSVSALLSASSTLSKSAKQLLSAVTQIEKSIPPINNFGERLDKEARGLIKQVGQLNASLADINTSVTGELRDAVSAATIGLDLANEELTESTESIRTNAHAAENEIKSLQAIIKKASRGR
jgi:hypothetical protein